MKNIDQYYIFCYNQSYRLQHMDYYREYCKNYNIKNKTQLDEYRKNYYKKNKYIKLKRSPY